MILATLEAKTAKISNFWIHRILFNNEFSHATPDALNLLNDSMFFKFRVYLK